MSKEEDENFLRKRAEDERARGNTMTLEPSFDYHTGKSLAFEEWLPQNVKKWDKLAGPMPKA
jgi:hypothetical protein